MHGTHVVCAPSCSMLTCLCCGPAAQATIMTDPETADQTYIGPMTPELVEQIIAKVPAGCLRMMRCCLQLFRGCYGSVSSAASACSADCTSWLCGSAKWTLLTHTLHAA